MNFKEFTTILKEAKFRESSPALIKQVKKIAEAYYNVYSSKNNDLIKLIDSKKIVSFEKNKHYKPYFDHFGIETPTYFTPVNKPLAKVKITDLATNEKKEIVVYCVYGNIGDDYAAYSEKFETINLYDKNLKDLPLQLIESKILHEITHGFQQYKGTTDKYRSMTAGAEENAAKSSYFDPEIYYKEPIEYDTHLNEIAYNITQKYNSLLDDVKKAKEDFTKKKMQERLNLFLQELKVLIKAQPEAYFKLRELTLPSYLENFETFLETIKDEPTLWKKFKLKMVNLYNKLSSDNL
jgi:hypothetical protein